MSKNIKVAYWVATIWLAVAMLASGIQQVFYIGGFVPIMERLQYPIYFSVILGLWKILGVVAILTPLFPKVKEWAYAGFFFAMSGAIVSHFAIGDSIVDTLPPAFLLILTVVSWYLQPTKSDLQPKPTL